MRFSPIELGQTGRESCPDRYNEASTLLCPGCKRLVLQVSLQPVVIQVGIMSQGRGASLASVQWMSEEPFLPVMASLGREFDAVRVRNYTPGKPAQVFVSVS